MVGDRSLCLNSFIKTCFNIYLYIYFVGFQNNIMHSMIIVELVITYWIALGGW